MKYIAIIGFGIVGGGIPDVIDSCRDGIRNALGEDIEVKYILDLRDFPGDETYRTMLMFDFHDIKESDVVENGELTFYAKKSTDYSDASVPTIEEGGVSIITGNHKNNENVFYKGTSESNYDWLYPQDDTLWNSGSESEPVKTDYDPCPEGWRVPTYAELDELNNNYSSWTTNENGQPGYWFCGASSYTESVPQVFFPAAGCRSINVGNAYRRGDQGYYWSSGLSNLSGYSLGLYFFGSYAAVTDHERANGYSVRCVQD